MIGGKTTITKIIIKAQQNSIKQMYTVGFPGAEEIRSHVGVMYRI